MRHLATDPDVFVRTTYARGLVRLADAAITMLELSQATKTNKAELEASGIVEPDYDSMLNEIQAVVEEQATTLLVDPSSQVKRAFLSSVLSHIMTYLNDRDWLLRLAFFDGIVDVGAFIGIKAVEEYVLPLMLQALAGE
jgi:phosphoinositide-3-kinase regulatory subunit 4